MKRLLFSIWHDFYDKVALSIWLVGLILRLYKLPEFVQFLGDQGRDAIIIKRILTLENLPAIGAPTSVGQVRLGPFYYYLIAPFLALWRLDPAGLAYGVAIIFMLVLFAIWLILRRQYGSKLAMWVVIFFVFSSSMVALSRFSWNPNLLPTFMFLTILMCDLSCNLKNKLQKISVIVMAVLLGLSLQLHYLALFSAPALLLIIFLHKVKLNRSTVLFAILAFVACFTPLILFDLKNNFINARGFLNLAASENNSTDLISRFVNYGGRLVDVINGLWHHAMGFDLGWVAVPITLILLILAWRQSDRPFLLKLNILNLAFFIALFAFLQTPRHQHYYGPAYGSLFFVLAYILSFAKHKSKNLTFFIKAVFVALFLALNFSHMDFLWTGGQNQIIASKNIAQKIIREIKREPLQIVPLPNGATDGNIRYFIEIAGHQVLADDNPAQAAEYYVVCFDPKGCEVIGSGHWQIANLKNKKVTKKVPFGEYGGGFIYQVTPF